MTEVDVSREKRINNSDGDCSCQANGCQPEIPSGVVAKLQHKISELEAELLRKESEMDRLVIAKSSLEREKKRIVRLRLLQLEQLAIINLELQKKISLMSASTSR